MTYQEIEAKEITIKNSHYYYFSVRAMRRMPIKKTIAERLILDGKAVLVDEIR